MSCLPARSYGVAAGLDDRVGGAVQEVYAGAHHPDGLEAAHVGELAELCQRRGGCPRQMLHGGA